MTDLQAVQGAAEAPHLYLRGSGSKLPHSKRGEMISVWSAQACLRAVLFADENDCLSVSSAGDAPAARLCKSRVRSDLTHASEQVKGVFSFAIFRVISWLVMAALKFVATKSHEKTVNEAGQLHGINLIPVVIASLASGTANYLSKKTGTDTSPLVPRYACVSPHFLRSVSAPSRFARTPREPNCPCLRLSTATCASGGRHASPASRGCRFIECEPRYQGDGFR